MSVCEFVSIDDDESSFLPKIVNFQNGQLKSNSEDKLQCAAFTDVNNHKTLMSVASEKMVYVGEEKSNNDLFYTLLTIRNKKTNKIRLVPVSTVSLNVHIPKINALLDATLTNNSLGVSDLNKTFGSKKTIRKLQQSERMKLNISGVEDEIRQTVADIEINPEDLKAPAVDDDYVSYRPPMNRHGKTIEEVYDIYEMITPAELDSLNDLAEKLLTNQLDTKSVSPYVQQCVEHVTNGTISPLDKLFKCKKLLYLDAILTFFKLPLRTMSKIFKASMYPRCIVDKILAEFTTENETGTKQRPMSMRDKSICYMMVLAFMALDYTLDLVPFSTGTGCGIKKLGDIARVVGAHPPTKVKSNHVYVLKIPVLPTPVSLGARKRS